MPKGEFYDLGRDPKKMNDVGKADKVHYPELYISNLEKMPAFKGMKIGDGTYRAEIVFQPSMGSLKVMKIKVLGEGGSHDEGKMKKEKSKEEGYEK